MNVDAEMFGDFNYVVTSEGEKIPYCYMCSEDKYNPPANCGYRLVFETDGEYRIIVGPYNMQDDPYCEDYYNIVE
jgi:hypothetical protein